MMCRLESWEELLAATSGDPWLRLHADAWPGPKQAWSLDGAHGKAVAWTSPDPTDLGGLQPVLQVFGEEAGRQSARSRREPASAW